MQAMPGVKLNAVIDRYSATPVNVTAGKTIFVKGVQQDDPARMQGEVFQDFSVFSVPSVAIHPAEYCC